MRRHLSHETALVGERKTAPMRLIKQAFNPLGFLLLAETLD